MSRHLRYLWRLSPSRLTPCLAFHSFVFTARHWTRRASRTAGSTFTGVYTFNYQLLYYFLGLHYQSNFKNVSYNCTHCRDKPQPITERFETATGHSAPRPNETWHENW